MTVDVCLGGSFVSLKDRCRLRVTDSIVLSLQVWKIKNKLTLSPLLSIPSYRLSIASLDFLDENVLQLRIIFDHNVGRRLYPPTDIRFVSLTHAKINLESFD